MPTSILLPDDDDGQLVLKRNPVSSPRLAGGPVNPVVAATELLIRFNPRLVGFGIVGPSQCDFLEITQANDKARTLAAICDLNPEEQR